MNILLIDGDHMDFPNLALMKISAYHKQQGDKIGFHIQNPDKVYISCVFDWNAPYVLGISKLFNCPVEIGGSGVDLELTLSDEIEHITPDYKLYGIHYSMGFTSRGCDRNCPWCLVPKKEGSFKEHTEISEFYVPRFRKLRLLDNNFLQSSKWYEKLREIIARKIRVDFNQGLDIRLIDREKAGILASCHYSDTKFKRPRLRFAFDLPQLEDQVIEGINKLLAEDIKAHHLFFYILCGYNTSFEEDYHRFEVLKNLGVLPFIMIYNNKHGDKRLRDFARWVNQRHYNWVPWEKYDPQYRSHKRSCKP